MPLQPDNLKLLNRFRSMDIEQLKVNIDYLEKDIKYSNQQQILDIAKNELVLKCKEKQAQIDLLTKSLSSSSRINRWISSIRALFS